MHIFKAIFYATAAWLIIACGMSMFILGFTIEKFLIIVISFSAILWCLFVKEND